MSDSDQELMVVLADEVAQATVPGWGLAKRLFRKLVPGVDIDALQRQWLLESLPYLVQGMNARFSALPEEVKNQILPDLVALTAQTIVDLENQGSAKKRRMMINALVNGVQVDRDAAQHRFFCRQMRELEPEHVDVLHHLMRSQWPERPTAEGEFRELVSRGLAQGDRQTSDVGAVRHIGDVGIVEHRWITELGQQFFDHASKDIDETCSPSDPSLPRIG